LSWNPNIEWFHSFRRKALMRTCRQQTARICSANTANGELQSNLELFATLQPALVDIEQTVVKTDVAIAIQKARDKAIAHYDVVPVGDDFRMWPIEESGLTFAQLDAYVDACTAAVNTLSGLVGLVLNSSVQFARTSATAKNDVNQYIAALVTGLDAQRAEREKRRRERRQQLLGNTQS
jgi:hypothetical protein